MTQRLDAGRLLRALGLTAERTGSDTYRVTGGRDPHVVRVEAGRWACDCADATYRPASPCKHRVAVYLARQLAAPVRRALRAAMALGGGDRARAIRAGYSVKTARAQGARLLTNGDMAAAVAAGRGPERLAAQCEGHRAKCEIDGPSSRGGATTRRWVGSSERQSAAAPRLA